MKTARLFKITSILLIFTAILAACMIPDYFSAYYAKNLVGHEPLSGWAVNQSSIYMNYESVTSAGTTGLPDEAALIYRLENRNLIPNGDFEATAVDAIPLNWIPTGGTHLVKDSVHHLTGNALQFVQTGVQYITYDLNNLSDTCYPDSTYLFRFDLEGTVTGAYYFEIEDTSTSGNLNQYFPNISTIDTAFEVPADFSEVPATEFLVHSGDSEAFRINFISGGSPQNGYIDNFRVIKTDQVQELSINLPFEDADRIDSLELISGTYRFSLWVKSDADAATTNNSFNSNAVTLKLQAFDPDGTGGTSDSVSFSASDYSSFTDWTEIHMDVSLQIDEPSDTSSTIIKLAVSPCDCTGGAITADAGSILISTPELLYSSNGIF